MNHILAWRKSKGNAATSNIFRLLRLRILLVQISRGFMLFLIFSGISSQLMGIVIEIPPSQDHFIQPLPFKEEGPRSTHQHKPDSTLSLRKSVQFTTQKININRANVEELKKLPGIGPKLAQRIVTFRSQNPPFRKVEELLIIKGVNRRLLDRIRPHITVE